MLSDGEIKDVREIIRLVCYEEIKRDGKSVDDVMDYLRWYKGFFFYNDMFLRFKSLIRKNMIVRVERGKYKIVK